MSRESYDYDWDELEPEVSGENDRADDSENSLNSMLHSILGGSSNRSNIGSSSGEGSFGGYGDDCSYGSTESVVQDGEEPLVGEQEEKDPADHGTGDASDPRIKEFAHTTSKAKSLVCRSPEGPRGGSSREENQRTSTDSMHQRAEGGHADVWNNDDSGSDTDEGKKKNSSKNVVNSSNYNNNGNDDDVDGKDDNNDNNINGDGDNLNGAERNNNDQPITKMCQHNKRNETAESARWPTRQSVESSSGYIFYARIAGDYPDGVVLGPRTPRGHQRGRRRRRRRRRRNLRRQTDGVEVSLTEACRPQSAHKRASIQGLRAKVGKQADDETSWNQDEGQASSHNRRSPGHNAPTTGYKGGNGGGLRGEGGVSYSGGLSILERDVRGAMVAVWLAWGVRIDAAREELRREERWLHAVHRTEIAKVHSHLAREYEERTHNGITTEVLECAVREAALREAGELERAEGVRRKALRLRKNHLIRRKDAVNLRRPMLESALRKKQAAELLVVRGMAEKTESKLVRARDDTVRLLELHLSRARRLVFAGAINTAARGRKGSTRHRQGGSLVLHEGDLLKLGKVLLLAQETANHSVERALSRRREGNDKVTAAATTTCDAEDTVVYYSDEKRNRTRESTDDTTKRRSASILRESTKSDNNDDDIIINNSNKPQSRELWRDKNSISALAAQAGSCLWCRPAAAGHQLRYHPTPYGRETATTKTATGRTQPRKPWKQPRTRQKENPYYASPSFCHDRRRNPPKMSIPNRTRGRRPGREVLRSPSLSPGRVCTEAAVVIDESGRGTPLEPLDSPGAQFVVGDSSDDRLEQRGGGECGYAAPRAFFCSWECAGRWNARFSPVQSRHERGLRIDIAAGRVVTR